MTELKLITKVLSRQASWKLRRSFSGRWVYTKNQPRTGDTTIIVRSAVHEYAPEASEETLRILEELGIE
jgi:hypothetical protein